MILTKQYTDDTCNEYKEGYKISVMIIKKKHWIKETYMHVQTIFGIEKKNNMR